MHTADLLNLTVTVLLFEVYSCPMANYSSIDLGLLLTPEDSLSYAREHSK